MNTSLNLRPGTSFPDIPLFQGDNAPSRIEADVYELESFGQIPADLNGRYYRAAYDWAHPPMFRDEIGLNGDGMATMFHFQNGHADFKSRYVRTEKFRLERAARQALFGRYRNVYTADPSVRGRVRSTANTHAVWHAGKLLMLKEDGLPWEIDPDTLETIGQWDFHGAMTSKTCTAHPSFDPDTGEMFLFGYEAKGEATRDIAYYVIDPSGHVKHEAWFEAPHAAYIHDFRVTRGHVVIPISPAAVDLERLKAGGDHWQWDPTKGTYVGVMPRYGRGEEMRWIEIPTAAAGHFLNAYDDGDVTVVDLTAGRKGPFPFFFPDTQGNMFEPLDLATRLTRWRIDHSDTATPFTTEAISGILCEMPQIDARREMSEHHHGFVTVMNSGVPYEAVEAALQDSASPEDITKYAPLVSRLNGVGHYDFDEKKFSVHVLPEGDTAHEVEFVPASPEAPEGVGYLLALVNRVSQRHSDLLVYDAQNVQAGPLGGYKLPLRLHTIHGTWVPEHALSL
ncbi:carotenoid oxygenase family protein [Mycolicibacterium sp. CBM1]